MKAPYLITAICAVALSAEATKTANAAMITETINFTATGFLAGAPVNPVIGSFTITLDPAVLVQRATTVAFNEVNITPSAIPPLFDYILFQPVVADVVGAVARRQPARHRDFIEPEYQAHPALSFSASPLLGALRSLGLRIAHHSSGNLQKIPRGPSSLSSPPLLYRV